MYGMPVSVVFMMYRSVTFMHDQGVVGSEGQGVFSDSASYKAQYMHKGNYL